MRDYSSYGRREHGLGLFPGRPKDCHFIPHRPQCRLERTKRPKPTLCLNCGQYNSIQPLVKFTK